MNWLDVLADFATIATAAVATFAYGSYRWTIYQRRSQVEDLLKSYKPMPGNGLLVEQIAAHLKLTIEQVLEAAQSSKNIAGASGTAINERRLIYISNESSNRDVSRL